jgi:hypothetical protein
VVGEVRDTHQEILFNVPSQNLVWDAPEGRPSSVTSVKVYWREQSDDGQTEFTPTGTVEANPNTVTTAIAGASESDPTKITLSSGTGIAVKREFLLTSTLGEKEFTALVAGSGTTWYARQPLINSHAIGSAFVSTRITAPVDASWVVDSNSVSPEDTTLPCYRVVWTYVVGGVTYRHESSADLVRYSAQHTVKAIDVDAVGPGWIDRLPIDYRREQGQWLIDQAFRQVRMDMRADAKVGRWLRELDVMNELVAYRAVVRSAEVGVLVGTVSREALELARALYDQRYADLIREPKVALASTQAGASTEGRREPFFQR